MAVTSCTVHERAQSAEYGCRNAKVSIDSWTIRAGLKVEHQRIIAISRARALVPTRVKRRINLVMGLRLGVTYSVVIQAHSLVVSCAQYGGILASPTQIKKTSTLRLLEHKGHFCFVRPSNMRSWSTRDCSTANSRTRLAAPARLK